ncbi:unnamed protein product [Arabis nemorensis]|uniref:Uncharacterized protein n=1 Tax=Arabis nemorensis TaxID=586526 RepID=A0A565C258_9BRAS|nr:unnamed protein product [Arabis nemorensis]
MKKLFSLYTQLVIEGSFEFKSRVPSGRWEDNYKLPAVTVVLGEHLHLTVGDYLLSSKSNA